MPDKSLKIFISYRRDDSADSAGRIYDYLTQPLGPFPAADVFKDVDSIPFGVHFKKYLDSQVQQCHVCLVVIGPRWADITDGDGKRRLDDPADFVRIEVEAALQRNIPVIPLLVAGATMPDGGTLPASLADLPFMNGTRIGRDPDFKPDMARLTRALQNMEQSIQQTPAPAVPPPPRFTLPLLEWINIPARKVTLEDDGGTWDVAPFAISKYPVTNAQYRAFIADGGYQNDQWWQGLAQRMTKPTKPSWTTGNHPRETVSWYEAVVFCRWLSDKLGQTVMLPTEMQWQRVAQGDDGRIYPWSSTFDQALCNTSESDLNKTTPVERYPKGQSQFGVFDMAGNVWEWCLNEYSDPGNTEVTGEARRVVRGGSWRSNQNRARAACRYRSVPGARLNLVGFRVVVSVP